MADIVLLFILKGRDCMSKVLIEVLVIILIAGSYLILFSAVRVSAIADQRIAEIRSRETFDKEKQLNTNQNSISGGMAMANKEKKIEGRLGYNSENGRYGLLVSDLWVVLCQDLVQVKMRNFSHFNPPEAQPQCVFFHTIVRIHLVTYSYNGYEFVSYCRKLPDIQKSTGMPAYSREF